MRIGNDLLDNTETPMRIGADDPESERVPGQILVSAVEVPFVAEEGRTIGDEILEIADLRPVDGGVIDLVEDSLGDREPDPARRRISSSDAVLVASGPAWLDAGLAGGWMLIQENCHDDSFRLAASPGHHIGISSIPVLRWGVPVTMLREQS